MKWTEEQKSAIETRNCNLLVSAGAGSGKTAVLVERIVNMVLNEKIDITNILVVTFTNAAATEMKERILSKMYEILDNDSNNIWLQQQILNINKANITTIHSFCLSVIRQYYYQIGIDPNFKVANDIDNQLLKYEVLEEIFDEQYEKDEPDDEFISLLEIFKETSKNDNLKDIILKIYGQAIEQPFENEYLDKLQNAIDSKNLENFETTIWGKEYICQIEKGLNKIITKLTNIIDCFEGDEKQIEFYTEILKSIDILKQELSEPWDNIYSHIRLYSIPTKKQARGYDETTLNTVDINWKIIKKEYKEIADNIKSQEDILNEAKVNEKELKYLVNMVFEFSEKFKQRKQKNKIADFNDFEHYALDILTKRNDDGSISPSEVAIEYKEKFYEILIDEYQDSNYIQEYILNTISKCDKGTPNIFMVGDVKQSIYRFRGGKPEIFLEKYNTYKVGEGNYQKINLYKNFRSRSQVLDFVNYIFSQIMVKELGEIDYTEDEYLNYGSNFEEKGNNKIECDIITTQNIEKDEIDESEAIQEIQNNQDDEVTPEKIEYEAQFVANRIKQLVNNKYQILDKKTSEYRDVKLSDIVILLRETKTTAPVFAEVFKQNSIPIFVDNKTGYLDEVEILEVLSFLQIIDNPYQDIPLMTVLKSPFGNFDDNEIIELRSFDKFSYLYTSMQKAIQTNKKVADFIEKIVKYREKAKYLTVSQIIWEIYEEHKYILYMKKYSDYESKKANLMLLFERAKQYEQSSYKGLFNFVNFIMKIKENNQDLGNATILGENDNIVRLMSIHKSKGLEFPIVFLSNITKKINFRDTQSMFLLDQEYIYGNKIVDLNRRIKYDSILHGIIKNKMRQEAISEEMRMLYVALTRAKEKLIITGTIKSENELIVNGDIDDLTSYMSLIQYCFNKGYNKNLIEINNINAKDIEVEINQDNIDIVTNIDLKSMYDRNINNLPRIDKQRYEQIEQNMNTKYEYEYITKLPHKISVSEIKRSYQNVDEEENSVHLYKDITPKFLKENVLDITPMQKGSIYHYVFEKLDFTQEYSRQDIINHIQSLTKLSKEEKDIIDIDIIEKFVTSDIYKRIHESDRVYKEKPFILEIPIEDLRQMYDIPQDIETDETVLVQGIIDLFFIEKNEIIILDYKTDKVKSIEEIKQRYTKQLDYYKKGLEQLLNKDVKSKYIYLVRTGELLEV